jgi:hypothetical protein
MITKLFSIASLLLLPQLAQAASPEQSQFALMLFKAACIDHMGQDVETIAQWAKERHMPPMDQDNARKFLNGQDGTVWAATNPIGMFVVALAKPTKCTVLAHEVNTEVLNSAFVKMMEGITRPGVRASKIMDKDFEGQKGTYHQLIYFVGGDKPYGYAFLLGTNPKDFEIQGRITVSPSEKPQAQ